MEMITLKLSSIDDSKTVASFCIYRGLCKKINLGKMLSDFKCSYLFEKLS